MIRLLVFKIYILDSLKRDDLHCFSELSFTILYR